MRLTEILKRLGVAALVVAIILTITGVLTARAQVYPLRIHPNGRYIEDQNGAPFFLNADSPWSLIVQLRYSDVNLYLTDRVNRGFNGIIVELIEHYFSTNAPANIYGNAPFTGAPFTTPNQAYFAYADSVLALARDKGLLVLLFPIYLGNPAEQGWYNEVQASSVAAMKSWGTYVGNRYKSFPNIIWVIGGDIDPGPVRSKIDSMVVALKAADNIYPNRLITTHSQRSTEAMSSWPESWVSLNSIYTSLSSVTYWGNQAYDRTPATPFFLLESDYEVDNGTTAQQVRSEAYWTVLSGGFGYCFGNCPIWGLGAPNLGCGTNWQAALGSAGSVSMTHFRDLFTSRAWYRLIPDRTAKVLTAGAQSGSTLATVAYTSDSATIIGYLPTQRSVTINPAVLKGDSLTVQWYNPSDGSYFNAGTYSKVTRSYIPPTSGDWVLVIDSKQATVGCCTGKRGNVDGIGIIDSADLANLVNYLAGGRAGLNCPEAANVDGQGIVDATDLATLISYLSGEAIALPNCP